LEGQKIDDQLLQEGFSLTQQSTKTTRGIYTSVGEGKRAYKLLHLSGPVKREVKQRAGVIESESGWRTSNKLRKLNPRRRGEKKEKGKREIIGVHAQMRGAYREPGHLPKREKPREGGRKKFA